MSIGVSTDNKIPGVLKEFCQHLVGFSWYEGIVNEKGEYLGEPTCFVGSGFIVGVYDDMWLLTTSGHMFVEYEERMQQHGFRTSKPSLFDHWSPLSTVHERIPFDFLDADFDFSPKLVYYDKEMGLDFAFISMPPLIFAALSQTIKPFRRQDWLQAPTVDFDFYALIGLPTSRARQSRSNGKVAGNVFTVPVPEMVFLDRLEWPQPKITETKLPQFVGSIHPISNINTVKGMSGGPIIGFKKEPNGQLKYFPVAIQSWWNPDRRIVVGCPLETVCSYMESFIREVEEVAEGETKDW